MKNTNVFSIKLKERLDLKDYTDIDNLQKLCLAFDKATLKLELDYKINRADKEGNSLGEINEFMYYNKDMLIGYIGIGEFSSGVMEINGMVHPHYRRRGIFKKLFSLVKDEIERRNPKTVLLLSDDNSNTGIEFIKSTGAEHHHSEYEMFLKNNGEIKIKENNVTLRRATNADGREIARQNSIYFNEEFNEENIINPEGEEENGIFMFMAEVHNEIVGKVKLEINNGLGGIYGLGILPEYRGKGYGRELLAAGVEILKEKSAKDIMLQVEAKNSRALNLYKSCGFEETSVMNYYEMVKE